MIASGGTAPEHLSLEEDIKSGVKPADKVLSKLDE